MTKKTPNNALPPQRAPWAPLLPHVLYWHARYFDRKSVGVLGLLYTVPHQVTVWQVLGRYE